VGWKSLNIFDLPPYALGIAELFHLVSFMGQFAFFTLKF